MVDQLIIIRERPSGFNTILFFLDKFPFENQEVALMTLLNAKTISCHLLVLKVSLLNVTIRMACTGQSRWSVTAACFKSWFIGGLKTIFTVVLPLLCFL